MPSLLVPRSDSNWGVPPDILVTPKTNIIMNKIYIQTYNGDTGNIDYRLRIRDELTSQIIYDVSNITSNTINNTVGTEIWRDFKDVKMISGRTYRLNITTSHKDGNGVWGDTTAFRGASNTDLSISSDSTRMFGVTSGGNFPEIRFDYAADDSGIFVRGTSTATGATIIKRPEVQEGDVMIIHTQHHNDATVSSFSGFSLLNKTEYSSSFCKVATKSEPASYTMSISTNKRDWILAGMVVIANATFVDYNMMGASDTSRLVKRNKNFAVVAGINGNITPLDPYIEKYAQSTVSIANANTNVTVRNGGWDSQIKYVVLEEKPSNKIKHIGSKSWSETTSYNGVDGKCTWSVPSDVQVGDLIIVMAQSTGRIINSSIPSPAGYIKLHEKYGPASFNNGESGSATFYKVATESDINSKVTFYTPNNGSGIAFGSINVYRDAKILSSDIVNTTGFNVAVPGQQEEVVLLEQVRKEYATPQGGYTRIAKHGYTATTMHQYFYNATTIKGSTDGDGPEYTIPWVLIGYKEANEPPTKPESFTKQPVVDSISLSGESITLEWSASTDLEGNAINYELEVFNGSAWNTVASNIAVTSYTAILPSLDTDKAQFRIRAADDKGGQSEYTLGNVFTIATRLLLIQDNNIVKSLKDGVWKVI